jgi:putative oxidoreductase
MTKLRAILLRITTDRWALVPLRLLVGFGFACHGYAKLARGADTFAAVVSALGLPAPGLLAWLTIGLELLGGVSLLAGAFTLPLVPPLISIMLTALFGVHLPYGFSSIRLKAITSTGAQFGPPGYELNLLYITALLTLAFGGTTPLSVDRWRATRRRSSEPKTRDGSVTRPAM